MRYLIVISTLLFYSYAPRLVFAQTCSCAGAPLINSQSISSVSDGNLLIGLTYQYKNISNLYTGDEQLTNRITVRNTQAMLLELSYGITDRLTLTGTFTYVRKYEKTGLQNPAPNTVLITRGIGDGLLMLKYVLHQNTIREQYQLAVGGGVKVPYGASNLTQNGIALNMDMQPGSGAWDGVLWTYFSKTFVPRTTINFFLYSTYRRTGTTERFGSGDRYKFGNKWILNAGITDKITDNLSYIAMIRYRSSSSDERNDNPLPNTGGKWVSLHPGFRYELFNGLSVKASGQIPVYQYLNGIQPTTAFSATISLFYNFGGNVIF